VSVVKIDNPEILEQAADVIRKGGIIIYPTDTLYGFGVDARNDAAIMRLLAIKGRSGPWSVAVENLEMLERYADVHEMHLSTVEDTLPGPVTLILPARDSDISPLVLSEQQTVGIRIPDYPFLASLTQQLGFPITSTSVNRTGTPPLNDPQQIAQEFDDEYDLLIDAGILPSSSGSSIIDLTGKLAQIVREGK